MTRTIFFIVFIVSCTPLFAQNSLTLWGDFTSKEEEVLQELLKEFEASVDLKTKADVPDLFEASKVFDVIVVDIPNTTELVKQDLIISLDDVISPVVTNSLIDELVEVFKYESILYGIPKSFDTLALFYNPTIFDDEGLEAPKNDWTWVNFIEASEELKNRGYSNNRDDFYKTKINKASVVVSNETWGFLPYVLSYEKYTEDQTVTQAVETYLSWREQGLITISDEVAAGWAGEIFISGQVAMTIEGSWLNEYAHRIHPDFQYEAVTLPETDEQGNVLFAEAYFITKSTEKKDLAKDLIELLSKEENQRRLFKDAKILPTHKSLQDDFEEDSVVGAVYKSVERAVPIISDLSTSSTLESFTNYIYEQASDIDSREGQIAVLEAQKLLAGIEGDENDVISLDEEITLMLSTAVVEFSSSALPPAELEISLAVPYIHQLKDAPEGFDGSWAALPTCAAMVLAYYKWLEPRPIEIPESEGRTNDYSYYISNSFTHQDNLFDIESRTKTGNAAGLYGAIVNSNGDPVLDKEDSTLGLIETLEIFSKSKDYEVSLVYEPKRIDSTRYMEREFAEMIMQESLHAKNPVIVAGDLTFIFTDSDKDTIYTFHHFVVVNGYYKDPETNEFSWIVNDPYGFTVDYETKTVGSEGDGANREYSFNELNPKYMIVIEQ